MRIILDVDVQPGNEHTSAYAAPSLWSLLDRIPRDCYPQILRGDAGFGNEKILFEAERRDIPYLFKLRLTSGVKNALKRALSEADWEPAGHG